jgi:hypothetical protein
MMEAVPLVREERFLNIDYLFFLYAHFRQFPGEVAGLREADRLT